MAMRDHQAVPQWVRDWHERLVAVLHIADRTELVMVPMDQDKEAQGQSEIIVQLLKTKIRLPYDILPDKDGYETVAHEALHASQGELFVAKDQILMLVPKSKRGVARKIWMDALERWTERTSWGLTRELSPLYAPTDNKAATKPKEAKDNG